MDSTWIFSTHKSPQRRVARHRKLFMEPLEDRRLLTTVIDFEQLEHVDSGWQSHTFQYVEDGFILDNLSTPWPFATFGTLDHRFSGSTALFNNTQQGITRLTQCNGQSFDLVSINLAELNGPSVATVTFIGVLSAGGTVNQSFSTDGVAFGQETFVFPPAFRDLASVSWVHHRPAHQFDDIVIETKPNQPPVAVDDEFSVDEDTPLSGNVLDENGNGVDSDPDGDCLSVAAVNGVAGDVGNTITLALGASLKVNSDGTFDYEPAENYVGTDTFDYTVGDGRGGFDTATVTIEVNAVIDAVIDVTPGNGDGINPINLGSQGRTAIAILTTSVADGEIDDLDATTVDTSSIKINGSPIAPAKVTLKDIDGDGDVDLLLHFLTQDLANILMPDDLVLDLTADVDGGGAFGPYLAGSDDIKIVPNGKGKNK